MRAKYNFLVVDINGDTALASFEAFFPPAGLGSDLQANSATIATALAAATNGKIIRRSVSLLLDEAQYIIGVSPPAEAEYSKVETGARLQFSNAAGTRAAFTVPAPKLSDFNGAGNANTVNPLDANMSALIVALESVLTDDEGTPVNLYQGGVKTGRHARRRPNRRV